MQSIFKEVFKLTTVLVNGNIRVPKGAVLETARYRHRTGNFLLCTESIDDFPKRRSSPKNRKYRGNRRFVAEYLLSKGIGKTEPLLI